MINTIKISNSSVEERFQEVELFIHYIKSQEEIEARKVKNSIEALKIYNNIRRFRDFSSIYFRQMKNIKDSIENRIKE